MTGALRVALLPGDGVGPEVIVEARKALDALAIPIEFEELPWGSAHWREHGRMMPADAVERLRAFDAILLGAVGDPGVPDDVTLWGLLLEIRQELDLWANIRPARRRRRARAPRFAGEVGVESAVFTRAGVERVVRYAFEQAQRRRGVLTSATKSNAFRCRNG